MAYCPLAASSLWRLCHLQYPCQKWFSSPLKIACSGSEMQRERMHHVAWSQHSEGCGEARGVSQDCLVCVCVCVCGGGGGLGVQRMALLPPLVVVTGQTPPISSWLRPQCCTDRRLWGVQEQGATHQSPPLQHRPHTHESHVWCVGSGAPHSGVSHGSKFRLHFSAKFKNVLTPLYIDYRCDKIPIYLVFSFFFFNPQNTTFEESSKAHTVDRTNNCNGSLQQSQDKRDHLLLTSAPKFGCSLSVHAERDP